MKLSRIDFQEMLDNINLFQTPEEQTLVDRYRHWTTGEHNEDTGESRAHINFLLELKYQKNGKSWIYKQRYDITNLTADDQESFRMLEMRFFTWVFEELMKNALKFRSVL